MSERLVWTRALKAEERATADSVAFEVDQVGTALELVNSGSCGVLEGGGALTWHP